MSKKELVSKLAGMTGESKAAVCRVIDALAGHVQATLAKKEKAAIPGVGVFNQGMRSASPRRNPKTGEVLGMSQARSCVKFKAAKSLKDWIGA